MEDREIGEIGGVLNGTILVGMAYFSASNCHVYRIRDSRK